jgi:hypothetical protein
MITRGTFDPMSDPRRLGVMNEQFDGEKLRKRSDTTLIVSSLQVSPPAVAASNTRFSLP